MENIDVSIVLNVHNELAYLKRTLISLEEAAEYATSCGITTELVVVIDNGTNQVAQWILNYRSEAFLDIRSKSVSNGSLGLSRNDGVVEARGTYIMTADADDLVSYNTIAESFRLLANQTGKAAIFPNYLYAFGHNYHLCKYTDVANLSTIGFFAEHPFVSRVFIRSEHLKTYAYCDVRLSNGFAFEDWLLNATLLAQGFKLLVAKNTILFYRQRPHGLLASANTQSARLPNYSKYYHPKTFVELCKNDYGLINTAMPQRVSEKELRSQFINSAVCTELTLAASKTERAIDYPRAPWMHAFSNYCGSWPIGKAYYEVCKLLGDLDFEDVILFPFVTTGGGEKFILGVLDEIAKIDPSRRLLVIAGERISSHNGLYKLPKHATFVDVFQHTKNLDDHARQQIVLRIIQSVCQGATIHLKPSPFAENFFRKFGRLLPNNPFIYYRFSDARTKINGEWHEGGSHFDFISNSYQGLTCIVYDHKGMAERDGAVLDVARNKFRVLSLPADIQRKSPILDRPLQRKLLWASRLDSEKRPEILLKIAQTLKARKIDVKIDVFGSSAHGSFSFESWKGVHTLTYCGPFDSFSAIPTDEYDAFLYTTAFDGLPNVVLEAMSVGLSVVAPNVGGIGEVVTVDTGQLIPNCGDDAQLVGDYCDAILAIYDEGVDLVQLRTNAFNKIKTSFGQVQFAKSVKDLIAMESVRK